MVFKRTGQLDLDFGRLIVHLPAGGRVTIEAIVRHLIAEHDVTPISPNWEAAVEEAEAHFRDIQRKRFAG